jgi:hypothetical protein
MKIATEMQYGAPLSSRQAGCGCSTRTRTATGKSFHRSFAPRRTRFFDFTWLGACVSIPRL